jgi:phosphocarrier protein
MDQRQPTDDIARETSGQTPQEFEGEFTVQNPRGLHARPGGDLIKLACSYPCEVYFGKNGKMVNGKSMIGLLSLGPKFGEKLTVRTKGEKAEEALAKLGEMIESVLE